MIRIVVLLVAVLSAGLAAVLALSVISQDQTAAPAVEAKEKTSEGRILVASGAIQRGERLSPTNVVWSDWPEDAISEGYIAEASNPDGLKDTAGAIARGLIVAGEPIVDAKIIRSDDDAFLSAILPATRRAVSVEISEETAAAGFILPGDRVDLLVTFEEESPTTGRSVYFSETMLQNILVLAVDQRIASRDGEDTIVGGTATLNVSLSQAEEIELAKARGALSLALRSVQDISDTAAPEAVLPEDMGMRVIRYGRSAQALGAN